MILHPTANLIARLRSSTDAEAATPTSDVVMRTWYCSYRIVRHRHTVLALNAETLVGIVAPMVDFRTHPGMALSTFVPYVLDLHGVPESIMARERAGFDTWQVVRQPDRSMTTRSNLLWHVITHCIDDDWGDLRISLHISNTIHGAMPKDLYRGGYATTNEIIANTLGGSRRPSLL